MEMRISKNAGRLATKLSKEEGIAREQLIQNLLEKEDRARHVIHPPFEGERRTRCSLDECEEKDTRPVGQYEV